MNTFDSTSKPGVFQNTGPIQAFCIYQGGVSIQIANRPETEESTIRYNMRTR